MADRTVSVSLVAKVQGFTAGVATARKSLVDLRGEVDQLAKTHKEKFNQITTAAAGLGVGLLAAFGAIAGASIGFDKEMSAVSSVLDGVSRKSLPQLRDAAIKAGKDTVFSATEAATAEEELAKAGISASDILGGALTGTLSLASAGSLDLGKAATVAAQAMNIFGLQGKDVGHIADVLAAGANTSATDVAHLGDSLNQAGLIAKQTGLSLEDTVGTLSAFAQNGLVGSDAGTSFKTMLQQLQGPSKQSADLMKQLGINAYNAQGGFIGITALAQQLKDKLGPLTQAERDHAMAQIFGTDATRAANILYKEGADGLNQWIDGVNKAGAAEDTAREKLNNLSGDVEQLRGSLETLAISAGSGANAGLRMLAQGATETVNAFMSLPGWLQQTVTITSGIGGAGLVAAAGFVKARQTGLEFLANLREMGPVGEKAATVVGKVGSVAGKLGIAGIAAFGLYEGLHALFSWINSRSAPVHRDIDQMTADLQRFATTGRAAGEMANAFGADLKGLGKDFGTIAAMPQNLFPTSIDFPQYGDAGPVGGSDQPTVTPEQHKAYDKAKSDIAALDTSLANLAKNDGAQQAKMAFDQITASLQAQGIPLAKINEMFGQYGAAATTAAANSTQLAHGFGTVQQNTSAMTKGLQDAIDHGETLDSVFKQLNGAASDFLGAEINEKQALQDLKDGFKKSKDAINDDTQAGRDNLKLIMASIQGAEQAAQAKYNETGSVQAATDTYNQYIDKLKVTLHNLGLTDAQINQLIATYAQMPPAVSTDINAPGLSTVLDQAGRLKNTIDSMNKRIDINAVMTTTYGGAAHSGQGYGPGQRWGGAYTHAAVGILRDAAMYSPASPGRYMIAEPGTKGEAFIPRNGDYARSTAILEQASRWYGGHFNRGAVGGGPSARDIASALAATLGPMLAEMATVVGPLTVTPEGLSLAVRKGNKKLGYT